MDKRIYICGCGKEFSWDAAKSPIDDGYTDVIRTAAAFLRHRHDAACGGFRVPRRQDERQAMDDIDWAAQRLAGNDWDRIPLKATLTKCDRCGDVTRKVAGDICGENTEGDLCPGRMQPYQTKEQAARQGPAHSVPGGGATGGRRLDLQA